MKNNYEILAPAGSFDTLVAAISAGAHALYLGGEKFSARKKAKNFSMEELEKVVKYAHLRGVKIYLTANILIDNGEMDEAIDFIEGLYDLKVDALIVQDLGLAKNIKDYFPDFEIHASTQMAINNFYGAKFLESFGFSRVVLARETPLYELDLIKKGTNLEIETFIHGALCVSYSGECLMSSMIGAKSGNRGECAQACRKSYEIISKEGKILGGKKYYLSPRDLNTLDEIKDMISHGAYSLKIEGRMKRPEYVYEIVKAYKKSLDDKLTSEDKEDVKQIFNRDFTKGLFYGDFGKSFVSENRPDNRGIEIGEVLGRLGKNYRIKFFQDIKIGDGLEFKGEGKSFGLKSEKFYEKNKVHLFYSREKILFPSIINRTLSIDLEEKISNEIKDNEFSLDLNIFISLKRGERAFVRGESSGFFAEVYSDEFVEDAQKAALDRDKVFESINKLGDTVFKINNFDAKLDKGIFLRTSSLNKMRRKLTSDLEEKLVAINRRKKPSKVKIVELEIREEQGILIELSKTDHLKYLKELKGNYHLIINYRDLKNLDLTNTNAREISIKFEKIYDSYELKNIYEDLKNYKIDGLFINNLSQIEIFRGLGLKMHADIGLNIFNSSAVSFLESHGFSSITLSPELNLRQIRKIAKSSKIKLNVISYGRVPVMTMEHCPYSLIKNCKDNFHCQDCSFKNYYLKDEKNVYFELIRTGHLSEILNSYPIFLDRELDQLKDLKIDPIIISDSFLDRVFNLYSLAYNEREWEKTKGIIKDRYKSLTKGHITRGILWIFPKFQKL